MKSRQGSDLGNPCMQSKLEIYPLGNVKPLKMFKQERNSQIFFFFKYSSVVGSCERHTCLGRETQKECPGTVQGREDNSQN